MYANSERFLELKGTEVELVLDLQLILKGNSDLSLSLWSGVLEVIVMVFVYDQVVMCMLF